MGWLREGPSPLLFKEGCLRINKKIPFLTAQTGWLVKGRAASLFFEVTNHPVCAAKDASRHLLIAPPPLLGKEGNGATSQLRNFQFAKDINH